MKKKTSKAKVRTPVEELTKEETLDHYRVIMVEDFHSKLDLVIEGIEALRQEFKSEINGLRNEMNARFEIVEAAIRSNANGIRELRAEMVEVKNRLGKIEHRLDKVEARLDKVEARLDRVEARLDRVEARLDSLEAKMDHVIVCVDDHEGRIFDLEDSRS